MQKIGMQMLYFEDTSATKTIQEIFDLKKQGHFQPLGKEVFHHVATESACWFAFSFQNHTKADVWLEIGDAFSTWYADFYSFNADEKTFETQKLGSLYPNRKSIFSSKTFAVMLAKSNDSQRKIYFLRLKGDFLKTHVFQVGTTQALLQQLFEYSLFALSSHPKIS